MTLSRRRCSMLTGSVTAPPPVLTTAPLFGRAAITFRSSSRNRSSPSSWKMSGMDLPVCCSISVSVSMKGRAAPLCNDLPDLGLPGAAEPAEHDPLHTGILPVSVHPRTPGTTCSRIQHP